MDEEKVSTLNDIDPELLAHFDKWHRSLLNDFFDGEQAIQSEQFYRYITKKPLLTKEEIQERTEKWIAEEKEIWNIQDDLQRDGELEVTNDADA